MTRHSIALVGRSFLVTGLFVLACTAWGEPAAPSPDWWSAVQKDIAQSEYKVTWQEQTAIPGLGAAWQAPNRAQDLRTYFTEQGPRVVRRTEGNGNWVWGLELTGFGGVGELAEPSPVRDVCAEGNRITFERDGLAEWYVNTAAGLEQGFTVHQAPTSGREMMVRMAVRGDLTANTAVDGESLEFLSADGVRVMHYGKLSVTDAAQRTLPATMVLSSDAKTVELRVDVTGAVYPVTIDPLATSSSWVAEGNQTSAWFGWSVATAGDVNNDGYSDVIVGAPGYDSGQTDEGRVLVYHGSATGLAAAANWTAESNQASAQFGVSVATAGDVNGDGYSDVIVGAPYYDNGQTNEGRACVYHGSATGLAASPAWTAESDQANAEFGISTAAAGDVNGDGYGDVVVGADFYDNGQADEGRVYAYYGSKSGLATTAGWTTETNIAGTLLGNAVSTAGDVNGDGYADVIVGGYHFASGQTNEGLAAVFHGSSTGLGATAAWTAQSDQAEAYFGCSVSTAGDVNGDGYSDVIVGASGYDNSGADKGRACVYHGSSTGLSASASRTLYGSLAGEFLGWSVATAGDVNGDGYADVIIGAPQYANGQAAEGRAYVHLGSSSGLSATSNWTVESNQASANLGAAVGTAGDVNGDGHSDVIVGAAYFDNGQTDEGRAFVYFGSASSLSATANWTAESNQSGARMGLSVRTAGDVNGDGFADAIVGAPEYDNGQQGEGAAFVYHGSASGLSATANWTEEGGLTYASYGFSVSTAGDVNGDGYGDVIVGAPYFEEGVSATVIGAVFVHFGSATGLSAAADWSATGYDADFGGSLGYSVSSAGDVNGDGYGDFIVGDPEYYYDDGYGTYYSGRVRVYYGSASNTFAFWTREGTGYNLQYGWSVSSAGDVNGDGYHDVIVGQPFYTNGQGEEGRVQVLFGGSSGVSEAGIWSWESNLAGANCGNSVSAAGDVNGDGYADVVVGMRGYTGSLAGQGAAQLWYGSATGLDASPDCLVQGALAGAKFGYSVSCAGDVNGDGYADVVVGAPYHANGEVAEGRAYVYHGSASGLSTTAAWSAESNQADAHLGWSVSGAGDVNGDAYADVIVGVPDLDYPEMNEGLASLYYGNGEAGRGISLNPRQRRGDNSAAISPMGATAPSNVRLAAQGRTPFGRSKAKLECEVKAFGTPFDGTGTVKTTSWTNTGVVGASFNQPVSGLSEGVYHWRVRLLYSPAVTPFQQHSRWFAMPWDGQQQMDFRLLPPPAAPSNPGATLTVDHENTEITWTWSDNSNNEAGFKVWFDTGPAAPTTLRTTTTPGITSSKLDFTNVNTQYTFQVAATNGGGDSGRTNAYSVWTLANQPFSPQMGAATPTTLDITIDTRDGNPDWTEYAIKCESTNQWVQADGALGASAVYRARSDWGTVTVSGLTSGHWYWFSLLARNGAGVVAEQGNAWGGATVPVVPNVAGQTQAAAGTTLSGVGLTTGTVTQQCSNTVLAGNVISQNPAAGASAPYGSAVALVVSTGLCPVTVPNVVGQTQAAAGTTLTGVGLTTGTVTQQCSNTVLAGNVISQNPAAGASAPYGSAVVLVVSTGGCPVTVPNVVGQTQATAGTTLSGAGLTTGTVTQQCSNTVAAGLVISQNPASGGTVPHGSTVTLVVSTGPCTGTVPDVVGLTQAAAGTALTSAGLTTGTVTQQYSATVAAGLVISQNPAAGAAAANGSAVALVVSLGPPPPITGSILINNNRSATNNPVVTLALTWAGGAGTGVVRMRFSNDGSTWTAWLPLQAAPSYTLPSGEGHKTVRVQYLDDDNFRSPIFLDYIRLDTTAPTGTIVINGGAATTTTQSVTLGLTWADSGALVSRMRFSDDGAHWTPWMPPTATRAHTLPLATLGYQTVRVQYLDGAGNYSAVYSDYIKLVAP